MITSTHYRNLQQFSGRRLPIRLHEQPTGHDIIRRMSCVAAIAAALIAPPAVVYALFMLGEANFSSLTDTTYRLIAVFVSVLILASLFARALFRWFVHHTGRRRIITINETQVTVREKTLFGTSEWREPLASYRGVERQEKVIANGYQHSLVLSHANLDRQVPVWVGDQIPDALVAGYQALLLRSTRLQARR